MANCPVSPVFIQQAGGKGGFQPDSGVLPGGFPL